MNSKENFRQLALTWFMNPAGIALFATTRFLLYLTAAATLSIVKLA